MNNNRWKYYKSFESDIRHLSRYIELDESNFQVYSIELVRLYLAICSEVDVTLKEICILLAPNESPKNISQYLTTIGEKSEMFYRSQVQIVDNNLFFNPWLNWAENQSPDWWVKHNGVKHQRNLNYQDANLGNVLNALCGLFVAKANFIKLEAMKDEGGYFSGDVLKRVLSRDDLVQFRNSFLYMAD
ncbi:hypothetical protein WB846_000999 [Vibrio parahaemolyticus]|uniref:hypothetical protein n=1 Tax=Vibrio parahaemolyticus TaxID=670 RepID=UPI001123484E|nr:hypothetical protein [Vibrio parahaemolyticus]TOJ08348.1 hypothetical protein CGI46_16560 [Vibrio parahaemolyticus]